MIYCSKTLPDVSCFRSGLLWAGKTYVKYYDIHMKYLCTFYVFKETFRTVITSALTTKTEVSMDYVIWLTT